MSEKPVANQEIRKRRREISIAIGIAVLFSIFTWGQVYLYNISYRLPFEYSIFFFGLVNLNIILLLLLLFLVFRNIVKIFVERRGRFIGKSLKSKLIAAFLAFSFVPTVLMLFISLFYINSSFDKWFSEKMTGVLRDSLDVTQSYLLQEKKRSFKFGEKVVAQLPEQKKEISNFLNDFVNEYSVDSVEFYADILSKPIAAKSSELPLREIPRVSLEFLKKAITAKKEASTILQMDEGNLIRIIVPIDQGAFRGGAIVLSSFISISLTSRINLIAEAHENIQSSDPLEYPIKSIYIIILLLMTFVILLSATWFGFHLAKELSIPLESLEKASQRITEGIYESVQIQSGSAELHSLIENFNQMTQVLASSEKEVKEANQNLQETLVVLDEHTRYIEVILSNISTGVISFDLAGYVTTINNKAKELLSLPKREFVGQKFSQVVGEDMFLIVSEMRKHIHRFQSGMIKKEGSIQKENESLQIQVTLSVLRDEKHEELGFVCVFDDLTVLANAQRAAAWREVARRIAHEIKNPLTPIKLSAQRLNKKFSGEISDPAFSDCTQTIISQVDSLKTMVNEFSNFARLPQASPVMADINQILREAFVLYKTAHKDVEFELSEDPNVPEFQFDPKQINRVLVNLIENSVQSMADVAIKKLKLSSRYDSSLGIVQIIIEDQGKGVSPDQLQRMFEPYFTTKGEGTGLGLAIVKRIVQDHNGFIRAQNIQPMGLRMMIELPVANLSKKEILET